MASYIASQNLPDWVLTHLGRPVRFVRNYDFYGDGTLICRVNDLAILDAVQVGSDGPEAVLILPKSKDPTALVNVSLDYLTYI